VPGKNYFFPGFDGRWRRALPAALFAALDADFEWSVLAAAEPADLRVTLADFVWDSALPAALFAAFVADFDWSVLAADAAAR